MLAIGLGLVLAPTGVRAAEPLPPLVTTLEKVADAAADVFEAAPIDPSAAEGTPPPAPTKSDNPRADITEASLEYAPGWIRMKVQVKNPTDPLKDPAWSDRSDAEWVLDTNNDGQPDYTVEFATDKGELYGAVFDITKPEDKSLCDADSASFSPEDGYTLVIDPKCIGNPKSIGYSVAVFFDTNPNDEKAPMATDRVPDVGLKSVAAPGQPAEAATPPPAEAAPVAPKEAPAVTRGPAGVANPGPARPDGTQGAPRPSGASSAAPGDPAAPAPAAPAAPLARTGSPAQTRAFFGLGLALFGFGLVVMTRPVKQTVPVRG